MANLGCLKSLFAVFPLRTAFAASTVLLLCDFVSLCLNIFFSTWFPFWLLGCHRVLLNFHTFSSFLVSSCCWLPISCLFWVCSFTTVRQCIRSDLDLLKSVEPCFLAERVYPGEHFTPVPLRREQILLLTDGTLCLVHLVSNFVQVCCVSADFLSIWSDHFFFWKGGLYVFHQNSRV